MSARTTTTFTRVIRHFVTLALPIILLVASVRLVMTPAFLHFEYGRSTFPDDPYGFSQEDRLRFAPYAVGYLLNDEDITYLSQMRFADGRSMFNVRELQHMRDVKAVVQIVYGGTLLAAGGAVVAAYGLGRDRETRRDLCTGLLNGSVLTLGIIASVVLLAVVNWDFFFTSFHGILFESGTWRFAYSDTLIRLFPEQFWYDAALVVGSISTFGALAIMSVTWRWKARLTC
jgi:integral membrane protein (TIGR01906 family)